MVTTGLSATLLAVVLAQAEQAPPEPGPAEPAPAEPAPSTPAPSTSPAPSAQPDDPPGPPVNTMAVLARFAYRLGAEGSSPGPAAGFSLGLSFQRRYVSFESVGLGVGAEFFHDSFRQNVQAAEPINPALPSPPDAQRVVSQTSFALLQTASVSAEPVTFWLGAGGGLTVASFSTPEVALEPGSLTSLQPMVRGAVGLDVAIRPQMAIGLRADYTHPLTNPTLTTRNGTVTPFGDLFDAGAAFLYRF